MTASIAYSSPEEEFHHHHKHHNHDHRCDIFGGSKPWDKTEWVAQDDSLRGGISVSHLTVHPVSSSSDDGSPGTLATFHGTLDSKMLGGAGFASQRTVRDDRSWNLSDYEGIEVGVLLPASSADLIELGDGEEPTPDPKPLTERIYTIVLKDYVIRGEPDVGKEISWEWNFKPKYGGKGIEGKGECHKGPKQQRFRAKWSDFKPFYRGKPSDEEKKLDTGKIKRFSIMIRSFFQKQQDGDFSVTLVSISAIGGEKKKHHGHGVSEQNAGEMRSGRRYFDTYDPAVDGEEMVNEKMASEGRTHNSREDNHEGWLGWLCGVKW